MSIWLFELRMPERAFWRDMNPSKLVLLLDARGKKRPPVSKSNTEEPQSLFSYLTGGE